MRIILKKIDLNQLNEKLAAVNLICKSNFISTKSFDAQCKICNYEWKTRINRALKGCPHCLNNKIQLSTDYINEILKSKNLKLTSDFIKSSLKINVKCLICNYEYSRFYHNIQKPSHKCPNCSKCKIFNNELFDNRILYLKLNVKRISEYTSESKMKFLCLTCNEEWVTFPHTLIKSKIGCPNCANKTLNNDKVNDRLKEFNIQLTDNINVYKNNNTYYNFTCNICKNKWNCKPRILFLNPKCPFCNSIGQKQNNNIVDFKLNNRFIKRISNYNGNNNPMNFLCQKCEFVWESTASTVLNHKSGCPKCAGVIKLSNEDVDAFSVDLDIKRIENYVNTRTKILFECLKCNYQWKRVPITKHGCPLCNKAGINEKRIYELFKNNNLNFYYDFHINKINMNENKLYRVDFYFPNNNLVIEYNGSQHYIANTFFGSSSEESASERLEKQQMRDVYINNFCKENGLDIIWIDGRNYYSNKLINYLNNNILPLINK